MKLDPELFSLLRCPETRQTLQLAEASVLERLNQRIHNGLCCNRAGQPVRQSTDDLLIRADGAFGYVVRAAIPVLLIDEAIALPL